MEAADRGLGEHVWWLSLGPHPIARCDVAGFLSVSGVQAGIDW